jgi:hypothetical protein
MAVRCMTIFFQNILAQLKDTALRYLKFSLLRRLDNEKGVPFLDFILTNKGSAFSQKYVLIYNIRLFE